MSQVVYGLFVIVLKQDYKVAIKPRNDIYGIEPN